MRRPWQPIDDERWKLGDKAATTNLTPTEDANSSKRRRIEGPAGMADLGHERSLLNHDPDPAKALSPGFVNMSAIHSPGVVAVQQNDSLPTFPYDPLNFDQLEIRVVVLKPGTGPSPITCDLRHVATAKRPKKNKKKAFPPSYTALSYTWGAPGIDKTIMLDGIEVEVRENLWQALYHLRLPDKEVHLWIDAICINQEDVQERNQQVSRMGTIYGMAKEVIVWLGPEKDNSEAAMDFIEKTASIRKSQLPSNYFADHLVSSTPTKRAISKIMERDYWNRVWIIQEVFRARKITIHCGESVLPWLCLAKFFRLLNEAFSDKAIPPLQIGLLISSLPANLTRHRTSQRHNLETLLETYKHSLCSDPRDRIYSLIGLARKRLTHHSVDEGKSATVKWITVDYTKSPVDMFYDLSTKFISSREWDAHGQRVHIPESRVRRMQLLQEVLALMSPLASSLLTVEASVECPCSASGYDEVSTVSPLWSRSPEDPYEQQRVLDWHQELDIPKLLRIGNLQPVLDTFTEADFARVREFQHTKLCRATRTIMVGYAFYDEKITPIIPAVARDDDVEFIKGKNTARFFTTSEGRLGIAPPNTRVEDRVYRFQGCDIALIFRMETVSPRGNTAILIGRALLLKSEREVAWEAGSSMAKFRYAVPTPAQLKSSLHETITLPLGEWRSLTW